MSWTQVNVADVEARWQVLSTADALVAQTIILDAQDILDAAIEAAGIPDPDFGDDRQRRAYVRLVAAMVIRVMKNPDGLLSETIDDYTYRRDSAVSAGLLYVSDAELAQLFPIGKRRRRGAFSIVLS